MKKIIKHVKDWYQWQRYCCNGKWHKVLVLLKLRHSPTFEVCQHAPKFDQAIIDKWNAIGFPNVVAIDKESMHPSSLKHAEIEVEHDQI